MLGSFLDERYDELSRTAQEEFALLLEQIDQDILEWVTGRAAPPADLECAVDRLIEHLAVRGS